MNDRYYRIVCSTLALAAALAGTRLAAQTTGEEWEYQGSMEMMGMKMPIPATKHCQQQAEQDMTPPVDSNCSVTDVRTEGDTTSFRIQCGPPAPMEGNGTTTRTDDHLESRYTLKSAEGEMSFAMTGRKLGNCEIK
jgi:hypothetical protein